MKKISKEQIKSVAEICITFVMRLFNTLGNNFVYLILGIFIPFSLFYIGQGQEIVDAFYLEAKSINFLLVIISFYLVFYALWVIPYFGFSFLKFMERVSGLIGYKNREDDLETEKQDVFTKTALYLNRGTENQDEEIKSFPVRYLANLPMMLFLYCIIPWTSMGLKSTSIISILFYFCLVFVILNKTATFYSDKIEKTQIYSRLLKENRNNNFLIFGLILMFTVLFIAWLFWWKISLRFISIIFLFFLLMLNNSFHYKIENYDDTFDKKFFPLKKKYYLGFCILILVFILSFHILSLSGHLHLISPIVVANVLITFTITVFDIFLTTPSIMAKYFYKGEKSNTKYGKLFFLDLVSSIGVLLIFYNLLFNPFSSHPIRAEIGSTDHKRLDLTNYYKKWLIENRITPKDTIILVAGQGGGSRAGAWMLANLDKMKGKNIFAISTVSGSSNGANNFVMKEYLQHQNINPSTNDSTILQKLYSFNYLSESFWGLLFKDNFNGLYDKQKGRNYCHQEDEMNALKSCYPQDERSQSNIQAFLHEDFIDKWYNGSSKKLPLLFLNSATTQAGKRAISAPIILDTNTFVTVIDVYEKFKQRKAGKIFLSHTAVNLSQSFPFTSAYTYLDSVANFIDGGLYENTGTNTLYEIYHHIRSIDTSHIIKLVLVASDDSNNENTDESKSLILTTIGSVASTPFSGHSYYWINKLRKSVHKKDVIVERNLKSILGKDVESVPLGIYLSEKSVGRIVVAGKK